jgi:hypothetical protein
MVMKLPKPLIDRGENYGWNEWQDYISYFLQIQQKKEWSE